MKILTKWLEIKSKFPSVWQRLMSAMTANSELQVWQTHLRNGECSWHAYDPTTGRSACFGTEAEMRVWIEMQYYAR